MTTKTHSFNQRRYADLSLDDIRTELAERGQIALIWSIQDVRDVRPDLDDEQAWEVLQHCEAVYDCNNGLTWWLIEYVAETLFPEVKESPSDDQGN